MPPPLKRTPHRRLAAVLLAALPICSPPPASLAQAENSSVGITTTPARLSSGSPFLLTVEFPGPVSRVQGVLTGPITGGEVLFFPSHTSPRLWYALAGIDVETPPGTYQLDIQAATAPGKPLHAGRPIQVEAAHYRTSTLSVPQNFVEPDPETQKTIAADKEVKDRAFAQSAPLPEWSGNFVRPVNAAATDSFGTRRTFNGKLASIHRGMDFRAASGTPVAAANSGKVVLARKLFYEGNCVIVDHGQGLMTLYMHLSRIAVSEGSTVRKGQRLGLSGATGRVTGPHLHFAVRWRHAYLDPAGIFQLTLPENP